MKLHIDEQLPHPHEETEDTWRALYQGLEFIGGDNSRSKINFFGNEMDIQYGPLNKVLINFDRNGVNFVGPVKFKDVVTFEGPVDKEVGSNKPNYSFKVLEDMEYPSEIITKIKQLVEIKERCVPSENYKCEA